METRIQCTIPVLPIRDLKKSLKFYTDTLGFGVEWEGDVIACVSRDGCCIMLSEIYQSDDPIWVWIGMRDDVLFDEYREKGVRVFQEAQNHEWAYEMKFLDIDGNVLWLGTGPKRDLPFEQD